MTSHPTFGVEEEFLLIDPHSGAPLPVNREVAEHAERRGVDLQLELTSCQVETATKVCDDPAELLSQLRRLRRGAADAADAAGARLLAVGLPPTLPEHFPVTDTPRYRQIASRFGMIAREQGISGCHVHVAVPDRDAAIRVSNRLRRWLPLLLALTANSAIYRNADSGHASWRHILWSRWPSAGPTPYFASADDYDGAVQMMVDSGAMLDAGMVYWDVRPSANFPTVEVRVADVPATVAETVLHAALIRAAVMTALDDDRGTPVVQLSGHELNAAYWRSAHDGLAGEAVDLGGHGCAPVIDLLRSMVDHLAPALRTVGDFGFVADELERVYGEGNGAMRQQAAWGRRGEIADVLDEAAAATVEGC
ncbi:MULTISPECIES: glutamate--cysteine ligase [Mycobacteriaceae]|uniref:Putative glutamate--cysteine ligase 2 n=1 Tax=Mycolicibacterium neoaurum VKM Ac-1815D TaxID=700508 RepID=V5X4D0_MYCNE|nr:MULTISPECIES: glutamate--cysteine ligase [Mycobacteriaceae]AHC23320.1 carboxylate--amine ligase [Mycolicibacterium neoaurum VKM Ac-1815D]AMO04053.1 carboxylate--amine ligase [Mycolicibacterium neoaurum]AXK77681.1 YbdK family carboxylate-amine ligase [Mycolicibacterium neoaurum]KJQ49844.1 carboxylate--amine ligase [Mycolicibacterium neoaurum]KUM07630.1 carboxylate--amine ligase [Mycolicibacterium neoaurum]